MSKSSDTEKKPILGSTRDLVPGSTKIGDADKNEQIEVTLVLRKQDSFKDISKTIKENALKKPRERKHITREEFKKKYGADKKDIDLVKDFARDSGLKVVGINEPHRTITLSGTIEKLSSAFGVKLVRYKHPDGEYRGREGDVSVPANLSHVIQGVFGLDNRPQAKPHFRGVGKRPKTQSYTPPQIARLYNFPTDVNGNGQCIAIIELGGGYSLTDLDSYFTQLGVKVPSISTVSVDGAKNSPTGSPDGPDGEVMLDIEVAGAIASGAKMVVYFAPNTDKGFLDAIGEAIHDNVNQPSVISISWGSAEKDWTGQALQSFNDAFQSASALGITVCAAAGDDGSSDGVNDGLAHVDFPASSLYVMACGGTRLYSANNAITSEVVWNDLPSHGATGGGISDTFDLPDWQVNSKIPPSANPGGRKGRGIPDISGNADPLTGYEVRVDGTNTSIGGTSAVAPLYAALVALVNQSIGKAIGDIHSLLYSQATNNNACQDITKGNNGKYKAGAGWDACTGLGRVDGLKLLSLLKP